MVVAVGLEDDTKTLDSLRNQPLEQPLRPRYPNPLVDSDLR